MAVARQYLDFAFRISDEKSPPGEAKLGAAATPPPVTGKTDLWQIDAF